MVVIGGGGGGGVGHSISYNIASAPSEDTSACANQSLRYPPKYALGPWLATESQAKTDQTVRTRKLT